MSETWFNAALDAAPDDSSTRHLFAAWLAQRGDARARGVAWMSEWERWPRDCQGVWDWMSTFDWMKEIRHFYHNALDPDLWGSIDVLPNTEHSACKDFPTRILAEAALCRALEGRAS